MDTARYARFRRPGHAVTGDRSQRSRNWMSPGTRVGYDYAHAIVDDHSRLAYVELLPDEKAATVTAYRSHAHRNKALLHRTRHDNERRLHSSIGGQPPIGRVHNLRGQDSWLAAPVVAVAVLFVIGVRVADLARPREMK